MVDELDVDEVKKAFEELDKIPLAIPKCVSAEEEEPGIVVLRTKTGQPGIIMSTEDYEACLKWNGENQ
jgi:hypothetical protein